MTLRQLTITTELADVERMTGFESEQLWKKEVNLDDWDVAVIIPKMYNPDITIEQLKEDWDFESLFTRWESSCGHEFYNLDHNILVLTYHS